MKQTFHDKLLTAKSKKISTIVVTDLDSGAQSLWTEDGKKRGEVNITEAIADGIDEVLRSDQGRVIEDNDNRYFLHPFPPKKRMIIIGAVHIAQSLVPMAMLSDYDVTVIDPRQAFATEARFPDVNINFDWPDKAMEALDPDRRTAVVTLTHDPKLDDPALIMALRSNAFYIGSLGSKRTHAKRLDRLREHGFKETELTRIHGPIGLNIGAISPAEISISIMGQITAILHAPVKREAA